MSTASPEAHTALGNQRAEEVLRGWEIPVPDAGKDAGVDGVVRAMTTLPRGMTLEQDLSKRRKQQPLNCISAWQT